MATEFQRQQADPRGVSIARLISNEFGTSESVVRQQLDHERTTIELDGQRWPGDKHFVPAEDLRGHWLDVIGPERRWHMKYPEQE